MEKMSFLDPEEHTKDSSSMNLLASSPSPLKTFLPDNLLEKLKLLNYERNLLRDLKMKPLSRFYFVHSFNPGEQFYMFTVICWWLCQQLKKEFPKPQESDDPHDVINSIINILKEMNVPIDFSQNQLIRGAGGFCLYILDVLANHAMEALQVSFQGPVRVLQEENVINDQLCEDAEIILEKINDEPQETYLTDDIGGKDHDDVSRKWRQYAVHSKGTPSTPIDESVKQFSDPQLWRIELEEVLPSLKIYVKRHVKDWRTHITQMQALNSNMQENTDTTRTELKKMHDEFTFSLDKFESREKHLNGELHSLLMEYKQVATELSGIQVAHKRIIDESHKSRMDLQAIITENDSKKAEMEQLGQMMSDSSYVLKIKKAVAQLREDVLQLNLELAILINGIDGSIISQMQYIDIDYL